MTDLTHRHGHRSLRLTGPDGAALPGARVTVEMTDHDFGFGNIGFDFVGLANGETGGSDSNFGGSSPDAAARLAPLWLDVFNQATLPFYWRGHEPVRGEPQTERLLTAARWLRERDVRVKGHPLVWHTLAPQWLLEVPEDEVEGIIRARVRREASAFAGVVDHWDALNEPVILPVFTAEDNAVTRLAQRIGRIEVIRLAFEEARAANPHARLVLNDFDLSADYERVIEEVLEAGIAPDALGVQTHMHQGFRGEEEIWEILERFARFGLPLQMTETTLVSGDLMPAHIVDLNDYQIPHWPTTPEGEARQADEIVRHYRTVFSHPAVESLTYWGIAEEGAWLGAPAGLIRLDGSPKPAYDALRALVKDEWWMSPRELVADADGVVELDGMAGSYTVTADQRRATVELPRGAAETATVALT